MRFYNGAKPAALGAVTSQTLLATVTSSGALGTVGNGVLTFNAVTQNAALHVNGTPTWVRVLRPDGTTAVFDIDVGAGAGNMQVSGSIATNIPVTLNASTITEGNV
jgi:hypothetical protein